MIRVSVMEHVVTRTILYVARQFYTRYIILRSLKYFIVCWMKKGVCRGKRSCVGIKMMSVNNSLS